MCENPTPIMLNRVMARDNVAVGVIFETKSSFGMLECFLVSISLIDLFCFYSR